MNPPAAVFDLEGTLTAGETWKGVARYLRTHGQRAAYDRFFALHLPGALLTKAGLLPRRWYQSRWMRHLAGLLAGMDAGSVAAMAEWVVAEELWPGRKEKTLRRLLAYRDAGYRIVLASGTYQPVLAAFARRLGEGVEALGTPLRFRNGVATGRLAGPINVGRAKAEAVRRLLGGPPAVAAGDTAADLPLLGMAGQALAVDPDPRLAREARRRGWTVL